MSTIARDTHRARARRIAVALGDTVGNRESLILADPEVTVTRDAGYPGCWRVRSRMHNNSFIYRTSDNTIVG
jgi:hypothetical protein